ncbi:hypothetical protein IT575_11220 [bacterium]|nr:hypothetical protein [bacterium]
MLLALACLLLQPCGSYAAGLPLPPVDPPAPAPGSAGQSDPAGDDAAAHEVEPEAESRELAPADAEAAAMDAQLPDSAEELQQQATEVLDAAQAELEAIKARFPGIEDLTRLKADSPDLPDNFSAGSVFTDKRGLLYAGGGVSLTLRSVLPEGEAMVEADSAIYDTESGVVELSGNVRLSLAGMDFSAYAGGLREGGSGSSAGSDFDPRYNRSAVIDRSAQGGSFELLCDWLRVDPTMREMQVRGLRLHLSLEELLGPEAVKELPLRTDFRNHLVPSSPSEIRLSSDEVYFAQSSRAPQLLLQQVKISLGSHPDPDLFITAREVELMEEQQVEFRGIELNISGFDWISWPKITRSLKRSPSAFSFDTPQLQVDREFGVAVKQGATVDLGMFKTDALIDYSPEYGVLAQAFAYIEPVTDTQLGVQLGRSTQSNIDRNTVQRRDDYNLIYRQSLSPGGAIQKLHLGAQYGHIHESVDGRPGAGIPDRRAEDTRMMADMDMQLEPLDLGGRLFLTLGARARFIHYDESGQDYQVLGGRAGLVLRSDDFDHFILYRYNNTSGDALFTFDEVRREQLDFATSVQTLPSWRNVLRGSYDPLEDEFDRLQLGTFKQQKSYEMGVYWDFARESAELEFGLLLD